jgi:hypothetical protein
MVSEPVLMYYEINIVTAVVLLREPWNPMTQRDVPDLYVADFGIASHVQTMATRITGQRGTPGYEAPVSCYTSSNLYMLTELAGDSWTRLSSCFLSKV